MTDTNTTMTADGDVTIALPWGDKIFLRANWAEASSQIVARGDWEDAEWQWTPYQVADARHRPLDGALLVLEYWGRDFFAEPDDDRDDDVILAEILDEIEIVEEEDADASDDFDLDLRGLFGPAPLYKRREGEANPAKARIEISSSVVGETGEFMLCVAADCHWLGDAEPIAREGVLLDVPAGAEGDALEAWIEDHRGDLRALLSLTGAPLYEACHRLEQEAADIECAGIWHAEDWLVDVPEDLTPETIAEMAKDLREEARENGRVLDEQIMTLEEILEGMLEEEGDDE